MILGLDSSSSRGSAVLIAGDRIVREIFVETPRGRGGALFRALEEILGDHPPLERVVVGTGPGSYNGIRAALAGGWGIAQARGIPLVGLCSLLGLAEGRYCAVGDARRGQYYFAEVEDGVLLAGPVLTSPESLPARVAGQRVLVPAPLEFLPHAEIASPSASRLTRLGALLPATGRVPEPLYLKDPFITAPRSGA